MINKNLIIIVIMLAITGCGLAGDPVNTELKRMAIPGVGLDAILFTRDGGATASLSYQISVIQTGNSIQDVTGNVFICDKTELVSLDIIDGSVQIGSSRSARKFKSENKIDKIKINYIDLR